jgi:hypothetical protein
MGVGSEGYQFKGVFLGKGNTISWEGNPSFSCNSTNKHLGLFAYVDGATFDNVNILVNSDFVLTGANTFSNGASAFVGRTKGDTKFYNCDLNITNATFGINFSAETSGYTDTVRLGGFVGWAESSLQFNNCNLNMSNASLVNNNTRSSKETTLISLGGFVGTLKGSSSVRSYLNDCSVTMINSNIISYSVNGAEVGGFLGSASKTTVKNGVLDMKNSKIFTEATKGGLSTGGYNSTSIGGVFGYSGAGSSNTSNGWGFVGNTIEGFTMTAVNDTFGDIIYAKESTGAGINAGGLIGLSFNNCDIKDATVTIRNGRIASERTTENETPASYGAHAGGIAGRLEHTSSMTNCHVYGNNLIIEAISNERMNYVGGLVGDMFNTFHRDIIPVQNCSVTGVNGTKLRLTLSQIANAQRDNYIGGIGGRIFYKVVGATVDGVEIVASGINSTNDSYIGELIAFFNAQSLAGNSNGPQFVTLSGPSTVSNSSATNVTLTVTDCTGVNQQGK